MHINPYPDHGTWLRANFHAHSSEHSLCGTVPLAEGIRRYFESTTDVLAITDHNHVTPLEVFKNRYPGKILLEGYEHSTGPNYVIAGGRVPPPQFHDTTATILDGATNCLRFICHPDPHPGREYWPMETLLSLKSVVDGIEIHNGHYGIARMLETGHRPEYRHIWDQVLTAGCHWWGYCNDDFHEPADFSNAFNMVCVDAITPEAVVRAAKQGACYGSTGILADTIQLHGNIIQVTTRETVQGRFIGAGGRILRESQGRQFDYSIPENEPYIRFEADNGPQALWLQPFFKTA